MYDIVHVCMTCIVKYSLELTGTCDRQGCRQPVLTLCLSLSLASSREYAFRFEISKKNGWGGRIFRFRGLGKGRCAPRASFCPGDLAAGTNSRKVARRRVLSPVRPPRHCLHHACVYVPAGVRMLAARVRAASGRPLGS